MHCIHLVWKISNCRALFRVVASVRAIIFEPHNPTRVRSYRFVQLYIISDGNVIPAAIHVARPVLSDSGGAVSEISLRLIHGTDSG